MRSLKPLWEEKQHSAGQDGPALWPGPMPPTSPTQPESPPRPDGSIPVPPGPVLRPRPPAEPSLSSSPESTGVRC